MRLYVVGLGPGDPELVTVRAARIMREANVIFVPCSTSTGRSLALRIVERYKGPNTKVVMLRFPMRRDVSDVKLREIAKTVCDNASETSVFAVLGDPALYSTFFRVSKLLTCFSEVEIVPGVTSITACAARALMELAGGDEIVAILTSRRLDVLDRVGDLFDTIVILKAYEGVRDVVNKLRGKFVLVYARRCFMDEERVFRLDESACCEEGDYFSMVIARRIGHE